YLRRQLRPSDQQRSSRQQSVASFDHGSGNVYRFSAEGVMAMQWSQLLSSARIGSPRNLPEGPRTPPEKPELSRSAFEQDYDRIIFSHPFRRLQDKTQVHPLPEDDFVHTRLTHSLEVSTVGRSLGKNAGEILL